MTKTQIAKIILDSRNMVSPTLLVGKLKETLKDDYQKALDYGWVEIDYDTGGLKWGNNTKITEMAKYAEGYKDPNKIKENQYRDIFDVHVNVFETKNHVENLVKLFEAEEPKIGDDVSIVDNGKTYVGKLKAIANGKYQISFDPANKPANPKDYDKAEINFTGKKSNEPKPATQPTKPTTPATQPVNQTIAQSSGPRFTPGQTIK